MRSFCMRRIDGPEIAECFSFALCNINVVKEIQRINEREINSLTYSESASWHAQYKDSAWVFVGGLDYEMTEGDVICIMSQYGEIMNIELIRDHETGKSKGFAFVQYEDQRSTILAVDNLNGTKVLSRTLRVDHSYGPKPRRRKVGDEWVEEEYIPTMNAAPPLIQVDERTEESGKEDDLDAEDPMAAYFREKEKSKKKKKKHSSEKKKKRQRDEDEGERRKRRHHRDSDEEDDRRKRCHYDSEEEERKDRSRHESDEEDRSKPRHYDSDDADRRSRRRYDSDEEDRRYRQHRDSDEEEDRRYHRRYDDDERDRSRRRDERRYERRYDSEDERQERRRRYDSPDTDRRERRYRYDSDEGDRERR